MKESWISPCFYYSVEKWGMATHWHGDSTFCEGYRAEQNKQANKAQAIVLQKSTCSSRHSQVAGGFIHVCFIKNLETERKGKPVACLPTTLFKSKYVFLESMWQRSQDSVGYVSTDIEETKLCICCFQPGLCQLELHCNSSERLDGYNGIIVPWTPSVLSWFLWLSFDRSLLSLLQKNHGWTVSSHLPPNPMTSPSPGPSRTSPTSHHPTNLPSRLTQVNILPWRD